MAPLDILKGSNSYTYCELFMNNKRVLSLSLLLMLCCSVTLFSFAQEKVQTLSGAKTHGCVLRPSSNLLVSLKVKTFGRVLLFTKELKAVASNLKKQKNALNLVKGKTDKKSKAHS